MNHTYLVYAVAVALAAVFLIGAVDEWRNGGGGEGGQA